MLQQLSSANTGLWKTMHSNAVSHVKADSVTKAGESLAHEA